MSDSKRLPRFRRNVAEIRRVKLTERDKDIIRHVARHRFLRSNQIQQLVGSSSRQLLRRLQLLYHHGWLDRPRCQIDYYHQGGGSRPMVYSVGSKGALLMRRDFDLPSHRMILSRGGEYIGRLYLEHAIMIADILIAVEIACQKRTGEVRFVAQDELMSQNKKPSAFRWFTVVNGQRAGLVPDAMFALEFYDDSKSLQRVVCCLEADRGTMPIRRNAPHLSSISRKLSAYVSLWKNGTFEKRFGTRRLAVLTVTTSEARFENIARAIGELQQGRGIFSCHALIETSAVADAILNRFCGRN